MAIPLKMTKTPSKTVQIIKLEQDYGAPFFRDALARFIVQHCHPEYTVGETEAAASAVSFGFR